MVSVPEHVSVLGIQGRLVRRFLPGELLPVARNNEEGTNTIK